ncbi:alpha-1,2-Mannosidase [Mycena venus]|uniref:alpha-1,2-Mannosidase n=1 Tax=Mycena venus TaxID=2733690 RepID=A0A8H6XNZ6_9AGAR|nr:alpha-1,2-Mannosidase [Mycena venus]
MFTSSYAAYKKYAFPHDDLAPVSTGNFDFRNGWGASVVDGMPTMVRPQIASTNWRLSLAVMQVIMGLEDIFLDAVNFSSQIDFSMSKVNQTVSVFETTIRYIGGLVASYELSGFQYPVLLAKAKEVADKLALAWVGNNDIPYGFLNFTTNEPQIATTNIAEAGSLTLEWSTLSKHTKNATYGQLATKSVKHIANLPAPLPGLAAQIIDPTSGDFVGAYVSWGSESDSYFEYLIKYARLSNTDDPIYIDTWKTAVDSSIRTLIKTSTIGNHTYLADLDDDGNIRHFSSHLACFHAGNWLYGGQLVQNQTIVDYGLKLNDGCWNTYASTLTGIGPELFAFISDDGNFTGGDPPTAEQLEFYNEHGFYITLPLYILRPEVLESNFYAWRVTGDTKYLDRAASAIDSFQKYLATSIGAFAGLNDVTNPDAGFWDVMESFWFAEVLKYLYLTFDDPEHISVDDYVFNTECQPFKAPPALNSYKGSGKSVPSKAFTLHHGEVPAATISGLPRGARSF